MQLFRPLVLAAAASKEPPIEKPKDGPTSFEKTFLDQYPTWSVRHAQKLAHELAGVTLNEHEQAMLIDCLTGSHLTYLHFSLPPDIVKILIGNYGKISAATSSWPDRTFYFNMMADKFIWRRANKEKDEL
jgi:hypothetical protein